MKQERIPSGGPHPSANAGASQTAGDEIRRLLSIGKHKQAVELAKEQHKRLNTADSQRLLVQAYLARIEEFQNKGMAQEAQTLLTLVQQRFPSERHQLSLMEIRAAAAEGRMNDLLRPLASEQTSPEIRASIEVAIRRYITDLPAVAASDALPANHPLRTGAAALWRAFEAVTAGPVSDADIALSEVSHRSPFAAWKLLIRAIAAFYKQDDAGCRRSLDAIPVDAAVAHLAATVRGMVDGNKPAGGIAAALYGRVRADDQPLRAALDKIEASSEYFNVSRLRGGIRDALRACAVSRPNLLEKLRQHISAWCMAHDAPVEEVRSALGVVLHDAYFWRLTALSLESGGIPPQAALFWERFLRHAIHEGMFTETSAEASTVWLHIAELLSPASLSQLQRSRKFFSREIGIVSYYDNQPAEIAALRPKSNQALAETVLEPGQAFLKSASIRPDVETFRLWWAWAERIDLPEKQKEDVALHWHRRRPRDVKPLLILTSLAESRNALSLAIKRLAEAEAIDPLNQEVRQARVRLTLSIAWRHFSDGKAHLVEKDLAELQALPSMGEGDRAAVLESMRGAWHRLRKDSVAEAASFQNVTERMGPLAAPSLFDSIKMMAKQASKPDLGQYPLAPKPDPLDVAQAQARIVRLASDLRLKLYQPKSWTPIIARVLQQRPCPVSNADLLLLGSGAIVTSEWEVAYAASSAGLARADTPAATARFLLLRAQSLTKSWLQSRKTQCLRASLQLARQAHDEDLIRDVFVMIDADPYTHDVVSDGRESQAMDGEILQQVLDNERKAANFPKDFADVDSVVVMKGLPRTAGLFGSYDDASEEEEDWDDHDDDYDDDDDDGPFDLDLPSPFPDLAPESAATLIELLEKTGQSSPEEVYKNPLPLIEAMSQAMGGKKISQEDLHALAETLKALMARSGAVPDTDPSGGQSKKSKKRKR